jgi:hypothetical protein
MPDAPSSTDAAARLRESLLRGEPAPSGPRARSPWAYSPWGILVVSVFVAYHAAVLLIWNSPNVGLTKPFHKAFLQSIKAYEYFGGTHNSQSWEMFAPNPNRTNAFVRVLVVDQQGELWDFEQDIWELDRYPYLWYSRMGKINRRIDGKKSSQRMYGAWICREWERRNGGEPAREVAFVRLSTVVPTSEEVIANGGWDQWQAPVKQTEQETIKCKTTVHAQLPNELRERYGLPLREDEDEEKTFRPIQQKTWWDKQEAERDDPASGEEALDQ